MSWGYGPIREGHKAMTVIDDRELKRLRAGAKATEEYEALAAGAIAEAEKQAATADIRARDRERAYRRIAELEAAAAAPSEPDAPSRRVAVTHLHTRVVEV